MQEEGTKETNKTEFIYTILETNKGCNEKPEYMTSLYGNVLVYKNHPRIILRGLIDSFIAEILIIKQMAEKINCSKLADDLGSLQRLMKVLQRAEIIDEPIEQIEVMGLNSDELREYSHNPKKYFGVGHLFNLESGVGEIPLQLNRLRAKSRELELKVFGTYFENGEMKRQDMAEAFNRVSSAIYIMETKAVGRVYGEV